MEEDFLSYAKDEDLSKICINCYDGINTITFSSNVKDAFNNLNYSKRLSSWKSSKKIYNRLLE